MNCFRYSLPAPNRGSTAHSLPRLTSTYREFLSEAAEQLLSGDLDFPSIRDTARDVQEALDVLSEDERVQHSLGEYYGLRLLSTEFEAATENLEETKDPTRLRRVAVKLVRELTQPSSVGDPTGFNQEREPALVHAVN